MEGVRFARLRAQMALSGVSRRVLAKRAGLSYDALCRKMNGDRPFSLIEAARIKRALGYEGAIDALFDLEDKESGGVET